MVLKHLLVFIRQIHRVQKCIQLGSSVCAVLFALLYFGIHAINFLFDRCEVHILIRHACEECITFGVREILISHVITKFILSLIQEFGASIRIKFCGFILNRIRGSRSIIQFLDETIFSCVIKFESIQERAHVRANSSLGLCIRIHVRGFLLNRI